MSSILKNPLPFENEIFKLTQELITCSDKEAARLQKKLEELKKKVYLNLTPYQRVQIARHLDRPTAQTLIQEVFHDFIELHGDRRYGDDSAIIAGLAKLDLYRVALVAEDKGQGLKQRSKRNFGMPHPEGYRKALRIFKLAEKFRLPLITIIDTPGAFPGDQAEERGQAQAIAENLLELAHLTIPTISIVLGEGGSGGALALGLTDKIIMFENAYYSVISPEGCASILFGEDAVKHVATCAEMLKLSAADLKKMGIVDAIIPEPLGGLHWGHEESFKILKDHLLKQISEFSGKSVEDILSARKRKYYEIGIFEIIKNG